MELTSPTVIKELLAKFDAKPSKTMGQNFLIDKNILNKIIKAGDLNKSDVVLEVGPGIGVLTQELAKNAGRVIAIEKDHTMINILSETLSEFDNIEVIEGDALEVIKLSSYKVYKVVANIPYYLTSHLIRILLEAENPPQEIVLLVQKEVAQRICPLPQHQSFKKTSSVGANMSLLSVSVQYYAEAKIISYVSKNCFLPSPKVDSAIIKIIPQKPNKNPKDAEKFFKVVKAGFSHARKQLANNLSKELKLDRTKTKEWLLGCGIEPARRAETLSVEDWKKLASSL